MNADINNNGLRSQKRLFFILHNRVYAIVYPVLWINGLFRVDRGNDRLNISLMTSPYNKSTHKKNVMDYDIDAQKFWSFADIKGPADCWLWQGGKNTGGYGLFNVRTLPHDYERTGRLRTKVLAHRVAFFLGNDDLCPSLYVCHSCDTPACVNPAHLWTGSAKDNVADMRAKGRQNYHTGPRQWTKSHRELASTEERIRQDMSEIKRIMSKIRTR